MTMLKVKQLRRFASLAVLSIAGLAIGHIVNSANAANYYLDVNNAITGSGVTDGGSYVWEDSIWTTDTNGAIATINYVDGNFPRFSAGTDAVGNYTITMNANHTTVGFIQEDAPVNKTLTITGTGTLGIDGAVAQGFIVRGSDNVKILNNVVGTGGISFSTSGGTLSGSLFLYGNNTYQGGTVLATSGGLNFNSGNSFGPGPITMTVSTAVLANPDSTAPITVTNSVTMPLNNVTKTMIYTGHDPTTFTNWTLGDSGAGVAITNVLQVGNTPFPSAKMIINNLAGVANSNLDVAAPTGVNGTLVLTGTSTYGGAANGGITTLGQITGSYNATTGVLTAAGPSTGTPALQADDGTGLPTNSLLLLNGGVLQTSGTFNRPLAANFGHSMAWGWPSNSTAAQTQSAPGGGGFSAIGSQLTVNINGDSSGLAWGEALGDVGTKILGPLKFGSINSNAKTLWVNPIDLSGLGTAGVTRTVTVTGGAGGDLTEMSGVISNSGVDIEFTKNGTGTLILSAANSYGGATTISAGKLLANNTSGSATGTSAVTVASGATLGGTGKVSGAVTNNGIIAPGASVGTLSVGGGVTDGANSSWSIELSGATADKLAVTGSIDLSALDSLNVTGTGTGSSWIIGSYTGTETGAFDTITSGYSVTYTGGNITLNVACAPGDFNCDGHENAGDYVSIRKQFPDITSGAGLTAYNTWRANFGNPAGAGSGGGLGVNGGAVPEPSSIALLMLGLATLAGRRRGR